jgi:hypothetical protein
MMQNSIGRFDKVQSVPFTSTPATAAAVGPQTYRIRLTATTACFISIGAAVAAYLPANLPEYLVISPGQVVSVVQATASGVLNLVEVV